MKNIYDVIIIGSGVAGLFTAINIMKNKKVLLISKTKLGKGSSELAQGGIVSCINKKVHYQDTLYAGCYYNNKRAIKTLQNESDKCIEKLINIGVNFEKDENGNYLYTKEGGHRQNTILYHKDETGKEIIRGLVKKVLESSNITILEDTIALDILNKKHIKGVYTLNNKLDIFYGKNIVIATGGIGQVYKSTTNPLEITGDGIAMAKRVGIKISNMEFIQFHPTAMYDKGYSRRFLISEAARGEGGVLINSKFNRFMDKYHKMKELAPRDIVSRAIYKECLNENKDYVYIDLTKLSDEFLKSRFKGIYSNCLKKGVNISKDYIKVYPSQHYLIGGIKTNLKGETSIKNIYACGECAFTGVHGANRLASNSLLEAIVFGRIVAKNINKKQTSKELIEEDFDIKNYKEKFDCKNLNYVSIKESIKDIMEENVFVVRTLKRLYKAYSDIQTIKYNIYLNKNLSKDYFEILNLVEIANIVITSCIKRKESIGVHYIERVL